MSVVQILVLGVVIGANNFSAALSLGALGQADRRVRIVSVFAVFEFVVPLVGAALGQALALTLADAGLDQCRGAARCGRVHRQGGAS